MLYDEYDDYNLNEFSHDSRHRPDFDFQEVKELEREKREYTSITCRFGHFKQENSDCEACSRLKAKKELKIQFNKEEKAFVNAVIGLTEFAIKKPIPSEIVGEICTFFPVISKNVTACRKTGQAIYTKIDNMLTIKKRVAKCDSIEDYKEQYGDLLQDEYKYAKELFDKRSSYICTLL